MARTEAATPATLDGGAEAGGLAVRAEFPPQAHARGAVFHLPDAERGAPLAVFVHHAVVNESLPLARPEVPVRFVVLVTPQDGAADPVVLAEFGELAADDAHAQLVGGPGVRGEDSGRPEF